MLKQIKIFVILVIILFNSGCFNQEIVNVFDCKLIKNDSKRDKCLVGFIEDIPLNNTSLRIEICHRIINVELRDACFFKIVWDNREIPYDLTNLCNNINSDPLKESCKNIEFRPHLKKFKDQNLI